MHWQYGSIARLCGIMMCLVMAAGLRAQPVDFRVRRYTINDGLSQSDVHSICRDRHGFIWFGTEDGLNRFDGYAFKVYRHDPKDSSSLSANYVWSVYQDDFGILWVGTFDGGLNRYDPATDSFRCFKHEPGNPGSIGGNNVTCIAEDGAGILWVGTWGSGLDRFDRSTQSFTHFTHREGDAQSLISDRVYCLAKDSSGSLWAGTWDGLSRVDASGGKFIPFGPGSDNSSYGSLTGIFSLACDVEGDLWVGTQTRGLFRLSIVSGMLRGYSLPYVAASRSDGATVRALCTDGRGGIWVGLLDAGLVYLDTRTRRTALFQHDNRNAATLSYNAIISFSPEPDGGLWIGTAGGGVNHFNPRLVRFRHFHQDLPLPRSLSNNVVRAVTEDDRQNLWVATSGGGLTRYDRTGSNAAYIRSTPGGGNGLGSDFVQSLSRDPAGNLWAGTVGGLHWINPRSGAIRRYPHKPEDPNTPSDNFIATVLADKSGTIWVGTSGHGLDRYDQRRNLFSHFVARADDSTSVVGNFIDALFEDSKGNLWIGTWGSGACCYDRDTGKFRRFAPRPDDPHALSHNTVLCFCEDHRGFIWIGTSDGLNRYDESTNSFIHWSVADGLPNGVVNGILEDAKGNLWISTNRGLAKFDPERRSFRVYDVLDGLQGNEFNIGAAYAGSDGTFYFGGVNGLTAFFPDSITDNPTVPPIVLTSFKVFDRETQLGGSIISAHDIILSHDDNFFSFEFAALDLTAPEKNRYAYMLDGFDRSWVQSGTRRYASYTHLDPGDYVFRVKGANSDGRWNEAGTSIRLTILPPFWARWWFRIGAFALVTGAIAYVYQRRDTRRKRELAAHEEFSRKLIVSQEEERKRIAAELHDSLGQNLVIIKNRAVLGLGDHPEESPLRDQLTQISSIASETLDDIRQIAHNLRPYQLDRLGLTRALQSILEKVTESTRTTFSADIQNVDHLLSSDAAINVYRIVQELTTNIVKHSAARTASVSVRQQGGDVVIIVIDDGQGFNPSHPPAAALGGFGLTGIAERVRILGGTVDVESSPQQGTRVSVIIHLQTELR